MHTAACWRNQDPSYAAYFLITFNSTIRENVSCVQQSRFDHDWSGICHTVLQNVQKVIHLLKEFIPTVL